MRLTMDVSGCRCDRKKKETADAVQQMRDRLGAMGLLREPDPAEAEVNGHPHLHEPVRGAEEPKAEAKGGGGAKGEEEEEEEEDDGAKKAWGLGLGEEDYIEPEEGEPVLGGVDGKGKVVAEVAVPPEVLTKSGTGGLGGMLKNFFVKTQTSPIAVSVPPPAVTVPTPEPPPPAIAIAVRGEAGGAGAAEVRDLEGRHGVALLSEGPLTPRPMQAYYAAIR